MTSIGPHKTGWMHKCKHTHWSDLVTSTSLLLQVGLIIKTSSPILCALPGWLSGERVRLMTWWL